MKLITNTENKIQTIPGSNIYSFTLDGKVIDINGSELPIVNNKVTIALYGYVYTVTMKWLKKYIRYQLYLPKLFHSRVTDIDFKPYSLRSHGVDWDDMVIHKRPMEIVIDNKLYRLVPVYPFLAVSEDGEVINITKKILKPYSTINYKEGNNSWYPILRFTFPKYIKSNINTKTVRVHRLVAMAWVPNDDYVKKPVVDHKDGNKQNYHASNLEWVSFSENNKRAAAIGLKTDNIDVKVMDYKDNKIYIFGSMTEACKFMGRSRINRIEEFCSEPKLVNGRYQVKLLNDMSDWDFKDSYKGNYIVTINGETKSFNKVRDVLLEYFPDSKLRPNQDVLKNMLIKKFGDKVVVDFPEPEKVIPDTYQVLDVKSGKIYECKTRKDAEKITGWSKSSVAKYIKLGPEYSYEGFAIRVKSDEPWSDIKHKRYKDNNKVLVENVKTGEILKFDSMRKASDFLNIDRKKLSKTIGTGTVYRNYKVL